jgi:hypothetical protein
MPTNILRCDICGRIIGFTDLMAGRAHRALLTPDSEFSAETFETLCAKHNTRRARARDHADLWNSVMGGYIAAQKKFARERE